MEKNIFRTVFRRENLLLKSIFNFFYGIASYPRMAIEVFTRREMGRRYFGVATAVTVGVLLAILPLIFFQFERASASIWGRIEEPSFFGKYATWYIYLVLYLFFADRRERESYPNSNVYDYDRFSLSTGYSLRFFYELPLLKKRPTGYQVEVYIEPALFLLIGIVLLMAAQPVGLLLVWCAIAYSISYAAAYKIQDDYFQDLIDMKIMNEETVRAFVYGMDPDKTRGVHFKRRPTNEDLRRKMASQFFRRDDAEDIDYEVA